MHPSLTGLCCTRALRCCHYCYYYFIVVVRVVVVAVLCLLIAHIAAQRHTCLVWRAVQISFFKAYKLHCKLLTQPGGLFNTLQS